MTLIFLCLSLSLFFIYSCSDDDDCPCTMEFRMITVVVVDSTKNLVLGLTTNVKDDSGKVYDVYNDPMIFPGHYTVMDDNYVSELTTQPKRFIFTGVKNSLTVNGEFFVNTDKCHCHVEKVSGPDTLMLR
ncbi:MAG TPA: hypothetical protein VLH59_15270 [Ignavibacteriaceae bacterium]|nr:hypothetical protein [Ignavibacteriaceae bacterium]